MLGHPRGVAPERVSKTDATDGSVRDRQALQCNEGLFHCGITVVRSRAEVLDFECEDRRAGFARRSISAVAVRFADGFPEWLGRTGGVISHPGTTSPSVVILPNGLAGRRRLRFLLVRRTDFDIEIHASKAHGQTTVKTSFDSDLLAAHAHFGPLLSLSGASQTPMRARGRFTSHGR
jgi:hypothetical protein